MESAFPTGRADQFSDNEHGDSGRNNFNLFRTLSNFLSNTSTRNKERAKIVRYRKIIILFCFTPYRNFTCSGGEAGRETFYTL